MNYQKIEALPNFVFRIQSIDCPFCKAPGVYADISYDALNILQQGGNANQVIPKESNAVRECFISGVCDDCWSKFPD